MPLLRTAVLTAIVSASSLTLVCGCGGGSAGGTSPTPPVAPMAATKVFVATQTVPHTSVEEFAVGAGAGATPLTTISPEYSNEMIYGLAVDSSGNVFVANGGSIYEYAPGSSGTFTQTTTIGAAGSLGDTGAIAVDSSGQVYVANGTSIVVFPAGATASTLPVRTITGADTGLYRPLAIALDSSRNMYVSDCGNGSCFISVFAAAANGNVAPMRSITGIMDNGQPLLFGSRTIVAIDPSDNIYFSLGLDGYGYVFEVPPGTSGIVAAPIRRLGGSIAAAASIGSIMFDAVGNLYANVTIELPGDKFQLGIMTFPATAASDSPPSSTITSTYIGNDFGYIAVH